MEKFSSDFLAEIKFLLDSRYERYNRADFIDTDPIQVPHIFNKKEDVEIAAFLTATIAWGQRSTIIKNAYRLMSVMDNDPHNFVLNAEESDLRALADFKHRTFNAQDAVWFVRSLQNIYRNQGGLEQVFTRGFLSDNTVFSAIAGFRNDFLAVGHEKRVEKHVPDISRHSAAKRINMFLRWMVRQDDKGVDFGLWSGLPSSALMLPLDVHTGDVARALGILTRVQNDWKAVEEVMEILRIFDPTDPVKYDFALFGIGAFDDNVLSAP